MAGELKGKRAISGSYIKIADLPDQEFVGVYNGYELDNYKGTPTKKYKFLIDGVEKSFTSSSLQLESLMDNVNVGIKVKVHREGEKTSTVYEVTKLDGTAVKPTVIPQVKVNIHENPDIPEKPAAAAVQPQPKVNPFKNFKTDDDKMPF